MFRVCHCRYFAATAKGDYRKVLLLMEFVLQVGESCKPLQTDAGRSHTNKLMYI